jgi:hypothetical protein
MRESGTGRRQGPEGVRRYTEPQTVAVQRGVPLAAPSFMSEATYADVTTATLRWMKRLRRA